MVPFTSKEVVAKWCRADVRGTRDFSIFHSTNHRLLLCRNRDSPVLLSVAFLLPPKLSCLIGVRSSGIVASKRSRQDLLPDDSLLLRYTSPSPKPHRVSRFSAPASGSTLADTAPIPLAGEIPVPATESVLVGLVVPMPTFAV